jgi:hypothetical protein
MGWRSHELTKLVKKYQKNEPQTPNQSAQSLFILFFKASVVLVDKEVIYGTYSVRQSLSSLVAEKSLDFDRTATRFKLVPQKRCFHTANTEYMIPSYFLFYLTNRNYFTLLL